MATFLSLCTDLARESGGTAAAPTTVIGQTGRAAKIVGWVRGAWTLIQNANPYWSFLQTEWVGSMTIGQGSYAASQIAFNDATNAIQAPRFGQFVGDKPGYQSTSIYDPAIGKADENPVWQITWEQWRSQYARGVQTPNRPTSYCLAPDGTIRFNVVADKRYVLTGEYRKTPQVLALDSDVPDMPIRFHDIIVWRAIMLMADSDEAPMALQLANEKYREQLGNMLRDLLPAFSTGATRPLA